MLGMGPGEGAGNMVGGGVEGTNGTRQEGRHYSILGTKTEGGLVVTPNTENILGEVQHQCKHVELLDGS